MHRFITACLKFVKDSEGKVVIWQMPNIPLIGWLLFMVASSLLKTQPWQSLTSLVSFGFLFTWAWLEITQGKSYFRRALGLVVLVFAIYFQLKNLR